MLDRLPNEITSMILSYCTADSLSCLSLVSTRMRQLSSDQSVWKQLCLNYLRYNTVANINYYNNAHTYPTTTDVEGSTIDEKDWKHYYHEINVLSFTGSYKMDKISGHDQAVSVVHLGYKNIDEKRQSNIPTLLITGSLDTTIKLWSLKHNNNNNNQITQFNNNSYCLYTHKGHTNPITAITVIYLPSITREPSITLVVSACEKGTLQIWHGNNLMMGSVVYRHDVTDGVPIVSLDSTNQGLVACDSQGYVYIWKLIITLDAKPTFRFLHKLSNGYLFCSNNTIVSLNILSTSLMLSHIQQRDNTNHYSIKRFKGNDKSQLLNGNNNNNNNSNINQLSFKESTVQDIEIILRLYIRSKSNITDCENIIIQDLEYNTMDCNLDGKNRTIKWFSCGDKGEISSIDYDESILIAASNNNTVKVFNNNNNNHNNSDILFGHTSKVCKVQSDHQKIVTMSSDSTIKIWNKKSNQLVRTISEYPSPITSGAYQGPLLIFGSIDGTINIYNFNRT